MGSFVKALMLREKKPMLPPHVHDAAVPIGRHFLKRRAKNADFIAQEILSLKKQCMRWIAHPFGRQANIECAAWNFHQCPPLEEGAQVEESPGNAMGRDQAINQPWKLQTTAGNDWCFRKHQ